jgi:hypothetical protein
METLPLFDPATSLRPGSTCVIIGHQNAGKTTLAYNFLQHVSGDGGLVVSHERMPLYPRLRNRVRHWTEEFRAELLGAFLAEHRPTGHDSPSFALLDCCIYDSIVTRNPAFRALFEQSRSRQITVLLTFLYSMGISPAIRASVDWVVVFREAIPSNVRRLYETWFSDTSYTFEQIRTLVSDLPFYTCLVLNTQTGQLFQHTVAPLPRIPTSPLALEALAALPLFQPSQILQPGDYCGVTGGYSRFHANLLCELVRSQPVDMSGGFLLREPKGYPIPTAAYATIRDRVRTDISGSSPPEKVSLALAHHLLDVSESNPAPTFALLDSWFRAEQVPFQFLFAHRRERQILLLSSGLGHPSISQEPDYLFCATILDGLQKLCPPSISYDTFFDMMLALETDSYIVLCRRTGAVMRYTPAPIIVTYI